MGVASVHVSFPSASAVVTVTEETQSDASTPDSSTSESLILELIDAVESVGFEACLMKDSSPTHLLDIQVSDSCESLCHAR